MSLAATPQAFDFGLWVDRTELRCTAVGEGPTVLLLHAGGEQRSVWKEVSALLCERGFRAVSVDQRGHGETGGPPALRLDEHATDLAALLAFLAVPTVLVGASLGGFAALMTTTYPNTSRWVSGVVLVDVVPDPDPEPTRVFLRRLESALATRARSPWPWPLVEDILGRGAELRDAAAARRVPLSLVRGSIGAVTPADVERLLRCVPSATVKVVEGAGHLVARDRPNELATTLFELLERPWTSPRCFES